MAELDLTVVVLGIELVPRKAEILGAQSDDLGECVQRQVQDGDRIRVLKGHERSGATLLNCDVLRLEIHPDVGAQVGAKLRNVVEAGGRDPRL